MLKDPLLQEWLPVGIGGEDAAGNRKVLRVEFEDGEIGEAILFRIEELVIENASGLAWVLAAEDPFPVRAQEGLRRPALDHAAQRLLVPVGGGKVRLIKKEQGNSKHCRTTTTGTITRYRLMPVAFMAVNSLVRVRTPKVTSTATSTPRGVML